MGTVPRHSFAALGALAFGAVLVVACRQIAGIRDAPPDADAAFDDGGMDAEAGPLCGLAYGAGDCTACVETHCCQQAAACSSTPSCSALEACLGACAGDASCRASCGASHGLGNDPATPALEACLAVHCADSCGLSCGGLAAVFPPASAADCQTCIVAEACGEATTCASDAACQARLRCQFSSNTVDVQEACVAGTEGGVTLVTTGADPIASACAAQCSWGADWSCVGHVQWPQQTYGPIAVTVQLADGTLGTPTADASVGLCASGDPTCSPPFATGQTAADGTVTLERPPVPFLVTHYLQASSPEIMPEVEEWFFPLSEPVLTIPVPTVAPSFVTKTAEVLGVTIEPGLGSMVISQHDCRLGLAPGVSFTVTPQDPTTRTFYLTNGAFNPSSTPTAATNLALIFNVPAGQSLYIDATVVSTGQLVGHMPAFVRHDAVAAIYGVPTP